MTALAANRNPPQRAGETVSLGVKANVIVWAGGLGFNDAGVCRGGVPTATTPVLGIVRTKVDNTGGADNASKVVMDRGCFPFVNGASGDLLAAADVGNLVYAVDDQTAGKTSGGGTRPVLGKLMGFSDAGDPYVLLT